MTDIDLKTLTPDTSLPTTGFLFGADSQASTNPSVYSTQTVATTLLGSTSLTGDVLTTSAPVLNLTQTWSGTSGTVFSGIKLNVTDTLSNGSSLLMDLGVGGGTFVSKFSVRKDGGFGIYESGSFNGILPSQGYVKFYQQGNFMGAFQAYIGLLVHTANSTGIAFTNGVATTAGDVYLTRKNTANLCFGQADAATAVPQTLSVQSVVAGTSSTAGADFTLTGSQNTGAGLAGNLIVSTGFSNTVGTATVTITIATPGVITWTAHGLVTGSPVVFTTTGALPTGITAGTTYFAITSSTLGVNTFQIATSAANAAAGTAITTSGTQSGVQTGTTSATVQSPLMTTTTFGPSGLTGSQAISLLDLKQNWNTSGTPTALKLNVTNTASGSSSLLMDFQVGGSSFVQIAKDGRVGSPNVSGGLFKMFYDGNGRNATNNTAGQWKGTWGYNGFNAGSFFIGMSPDGSDSGNVENVDVKLYRDGSNIFGQRNGTAAQTFNIYSTYTDGSNYSRASLSFSTPSNGTSAFTINANGAAGSGTAQELWLKAANNVYFGGGVGYTWTINNTGHFFTGADNVYDIGQSSTNRPRNVYVATSITPGAGVVIASLPTPATGMVARVTNALAPAIGTAVAGGGAAQALVWYNGANWTVIGV